MPDAGAALGGLVTGLREGVEAALIVSILLAYLVRTGNGALASRVWAGVASAMVASLALGLAIFVTVGELTAPLEQLFEASILLVATGIVTWMLFWMRRTAGSASGELRQAVDRAVAGGSAVGIFVLAFAAVAREGVETSLFLVGQATAVGQGGGSSAFGVLVGALAGLGIAALLGVGFYRGTRRIDLGRFFRWTGIALIVIAAGLLAGAVAELAEIGLIPFGGATAYDLTAVLPDETGAGQFLRALVGYHAAPSWIGFLAQFGYIAAVLALYLRPFAPRPLASASGSASKVAAA